MVNSLENIDKSKVYASRIEGLDVEIQNQLPNASDNKSINTNTSDKLQTIGIIDNNNTTNAIKVWTGTRSQYDAILVKDSNTLYNITDDTDVSLTLLNVLYPIGAIYIGTMNACPLQVLGVGTWQLVSSGRVLQGAASGQTIGTTVEAGLPNITGSVSVDFKSTGTITATGCINETHHSEGWVGFNNTTETVLDSISVDASQSNSIYGNSDTVQPPAYLVNIWERIQ